MMSPDKAACYARHRQYKHLCLVTSHVMPITHPHLHSHTTLYEGAVRLLIYKYLQQNRKKTCTKNTLALIFRAPVSTKTTRVSQQYLKIAPAVIVMTSVRLPCKLSAARQAVPVLGYPVFVQTEDRVR